MIIAAVAVFGITRLKEEEDLLVFLPSSDPDVQLFKDVSKKFGGLRVALIGVEAPAGQDVFSPETLGRLLREEGFEVLRVFRGDDHGRPFDGALARAHGSSVPGRILRRWVGAGMVVYGRKR